MNQPDTSKHPIAAVAMFIHRDGHILCLQRGPTQNGAGTWCLPGGKVDHGETLEQAAIRETLEETGVNVTKCTHLPGVCDTVDPEGHHFVTHFFYADLTEGEPELLDEKAVDLKWLNIIQPYRSPDYLLFHPLAHALNTFVCISLLSRILFPSRHQ